MLLKLIAKIYKYSKQSTDSFKKIVSKRDSCGLALFSNTNVKTDSFFCHKCQQLENIQYIYTSDILVCGIKFNFSVISKYMTAHKVCIVLG